MIFFEIERLAVAMLESPRPWEAQHRYTRRVTLSMTFLQ